MTIAPMLSLLWAITCLACLFLLIEWRAALWRAEKLRRMHEGACERIAAASAVIAKNAERGPLARLKQWLASGNGLHEPYIEFAPFGWFVELSNDQGERISVFGWPAGCGGASGTLHLHEGADLGECLTAALDLWGQVRGARCADGE